jgi:methionyl-tRNA synthetase
VYWPALLMAAGLELPQHLMVHGYLLMNEQKMSKSLGNVLDPFVIMERFGTDALRYYCFREVSFGQDGSVSTEGFEARYETELANEYGNLASRTIAMLTRYREGVVPAVDTDAELGRELQSARDEVCGLLDRAEITQALDAIWRRVRRLNRYVEERAPWKLARDPEAAGELDTTLASLVEGLRVVTVLLAPWMPATATRLLGALGMEDDSLAAAQFASRGWGSRVSALDPLFPK